MKSPERPFDYKKDYYPKRFATPLLEWGGQNLLPSSTEVLTPDQRADKDMDETLELLFPDSSTKEPLTSMQDFVLGLVDTLGLSKNGRAEALDSLGSVDDEIPFGERVHESGYTGDELYGQLQDRIASKSRVRNIRRAGLLFIALATGTGAQIFPQVKHGEAYVAERVGHVFERTGHFIRNARNLGKNEINQAPQETTYHLIAPERVINGEKRPIEATIYLDQTPELDQPVPSTVTPEELASQGFDLNNLQGSPVEGHITRLSEEGKIEVESGEKVIDEYLSLDGAYKEFDSEGNIAAEHRIYIPSIFFARNESDTKPTTGTSTMASDNPAGPQNTRAA